MQLPDNAIDYAPEDLAAVVLEYINKRYKAQKDGFSYHNETMSLGDESGIAFAEAWAWLVREGLVVPRPSTGGKLGGASDWFVPSRRGRAINTRDQMQSFVRARLLPRAQLHAAILTASSALFEKGQYDTAVFAALKELEIAVRNKAGLPNSLVGVDLMRTAFKVGGKLADPSEERGETDGLMHLFAGAIGRYRNSTGHRRVEIEPERASEVLVLASHLLKIVDERGSS